MGGNIVVEVGKSFSIASYNGPWILPYKTPASFTSGVRSYRDYFQLLCFLHLKEFGVRTHNHAPSSLKKTEQIGECPSLLP